MSKIHISQKALRDDGAQFAGGSRDAVTSAAESSWKQLCRGLDTVSLCSMSPRETE